ncbi:plasmid pRiA4b ORF-3 family protein [Sphingomonas adhaesiva]|uniref:plasmid pRiA4b ORF-3 family protein n=1 Tax=Sphingomonas adhaesiva TaxID=28212 RepID=UPI002FF821E0
MTPELPAALLAFMFVPPNAIQLRVSIDGIDPPVWRRLVVPAAWDLAQLHLVIQAAFNWWNYHLHEFQIGGLRYGDAALSDEGSVDGDLRVFDEREIRLRDFRGDAISFAYLYDFGDDWHHTIEIEDMLFLDPAPLHATCIDGARARPPEDVGGIPGYEQFLDVIADPKHPEYKETNRWCGGHFDPEWFDLAMVSKDMRGALKPGVKRRLHQPKPRKSVT